MSEYRIVADNYCGYEVQIRRWWFPIWVEADFCNSHSTVASAEKWAERHAQGCVKYLGRFERAAAPQLPQEITSE